MNLKEYNAQEIAKVSECKYCGKDSLPQSVRHAKRPNGSWRSFCERCRLNLKQVDLNIRMDRL